MIVFFNCAFPAILTIINVTFTIKVEIGEALCVDLDKTNHLEKLKIVLLLWTNHGNIFLLSFF